MTESEVAIGVDDVFRWPVSVVEATPSGVVVVLDDEPVKVVFLSCGLHLVDVFFERELWSVNA